MWLPSKGGNGIRLKIASNTFKKTNMPSIATTPAPRPAAMAPVMASAPAAARPMLTAGPAKATKAMSLTGFLK